MLRRLRHSSRLTAPFAFAIAAMILLGTVDWWHAGDDDSGPQLFHDHAAHHYAFHSPRADVRPSEHCYLCHWLRALGNGLRLVSHDGLIAAEGRSVLLASPCRKSDLAVALLPARAPPA